MISADIDINGSVWARRPIFGAALGAIRDYDRIDHLAVIAAVDRNLSAWRARMVPAHRILRNSAPGID